MQDLVVSNKGVRQVHSSHVLVFLHHWWYWDVLQCRLPICTFDSPLDCVIRVSSVMCGAQRNVPLISPLNEEEGVFTNSPDEFSQIHLMLPRGDLVSNMLTLVFGKRVKVVHKEFISCSK